ncbi:hypothetical protein F5Y17DRAFT_266806 [Xylariaceae sp. FL0594]|nr:hypothetical protein F5Y17DRAFT_266806 [Xylariaceae sp. FL0594]
MLQGADVMLADGRNQTPLDFAMNQGNQSIVQLLLGRGKWCLRHILSSPDSSTLWWPSVTFSPDFTLMASTGLREVHLWDTATGRRMRSFAWKVHAGCLTTCFSPNSRILAFAKTSHTLNICEVETGILLNSYTGCSAIRQIAFSPNSDEFAVESSYGTIRYWAEVQGNPRTTYRTIHLLWKDRARFSPDLKLFAIAPSDGKIEIRHVSTGQLQRTLKQEDMHLPKMTFSPNSRFLAATTFSCRPALWDIESGELLELNWYADMFESEILFSPDSKLVGLRTEYWSSEGMALKLWNVETGAKKGKWKVPRGHGRVELSPNLVQAVTHTKNDVRVWDMQTQQAHQVITCDCRSVVYSPDSRLAAILLLDGSIQLWDVSWIQ